MNIAMIENIVIAVTALLVLVLPSLGVWLLTRRRRLRVGCLCLPLLILPGCFAVNYYHVTYDDPREEAYAQAHEDPNELTDHDSIAGNLLVLMFSWVPPTVAGLFTLLVLGLVRRAKVPGSESRPHSPPA